MISFKSNKYISDFFECKTDLFSQNFNLNKNSNKRGSHFESKIKSNKKNSFNFLTWTNDLKNRENLTEGEYKHIGDDLRQSLIGYEKTKLEEEMKNIDKTETTDLIKKLPTMKRKNSIGHHFKKNLTDLTDETISKDNIKYNKEKFRFLQHTGYVYDSLDDEEIEDAIDINYYYINPDSIFIYIFDSIIAILSFYCLYYFPFYLAHDSFSNSSIFNIKIILFFIIDFFYIIDLIISFFRAYYNYDEILIKNILDMSCNYINNWFFLDFLSAIPFYFIIFLLEKKGRNIGFSRNVFSLAYFGVKIYKFHYLLILNKLLKIFKCFSNNNRALSKIIQFLFRNDRIEEKSGIFLVIFILLSASNFGTCIFIFIGRNSYPSWMNAIHLDNRSFSSIYICSLYYLITTITTVGYGDIYGRTIPEILYQIILLMIGTCTYSYLISSVSNFIKKISEKSLIFENKLKILNDIKLTNPHMQEYLYDKILRFLRYKKNTEKNKQKVIINSLPYSLRNLLIIEMYKPIINNFIIFKGLENSNCIVQLVTAFKPIFAIKNDILIQEGDFIEEVIFVKTGIISLEIGIDLNNPKESIIQYLNENNEKDKSFRQSTYGVLNFTYNSISTTSSFLQNRKTTIKNEKKEKNTHYLKVLDIRKNEHFGETLMFLNERSPLTAKVKSKKAELFFLKKEEVIKIFNAFPNIWNRINKKSLYNMKQIKIIVKKVLLKFCSMIGINLNDITENDKKIKLIKNLKKNKKNNRNQNRKENIKKDVKEKKEKNNQNNESNIKNELNNNFNKNNELDLSIIKSYNSLNEKNESSNNNQEDIKNKLRSDKNYINESITYTSKDNILNYDNNNIKKSNYQSNEINDFQNKNKINNSSTFLKEVKNNSTNDIHKINDYNVRNNNDDSSRETVKISINKRLYSLIDSESLEEKESNFKNEHYYVNDEIYNNEKFNLKCDFKEDLLNKKNLYNLINNKNKIELLSRQLLEKTWIKNLDKEKVNYLDKLLNKPKDNDNNSLKEKKNIYKKDSSFYSSSSDSSWMLNIANNESFEIKASYENINEITSNKYIKNNALRNRTKEFLLKQCE